MTMSVMPMPGRAASIPTYVPEPAPRPMTALPIGFDAFVAKHRAAWLRDAEATLTTLDWRAYVGGRTLHVLDAQAIGGPAHGYLGFTASAHLHLLAAELLPLKRCSSPTAAVAVNVEAMVAVFREAELSERTEQLAAGMARAMIAAVAAHELAHVVSAQAAGETLRPTASLRNILESLSDGRAYAAPHQLTSHGPAWVRAFAHLVTRASRLPHHDLWVSGFERDVRHVLPHPPADYLEALHPELARFTADDLLIDILRTPAPAGFTAMFNQRAAAQPAEEER